MISYFEHNKKARGEEIVARLSSGESGALVTDAGMPGISDPGEDIVRLCIENGIPVTLVPGPCAAVTALVLSGLPTAKFIFEGFLPQKASEIDKRIEELSHETRTIVLYEAPHRLKSTSRYAVSLLKSTRRSSGLRLHRLAITIPKMIRAANMF